LLFHQFVLLVLTVVSLFIGERTQAKEDLLQEQGMQEAYLAQSNPVQERQG